MKTIEEFKKTLEQTAPENFGFKVGDVVEWTNCNGVKFIDKIIGFDFSDKNPLKKYGKVVHLDTDAFWFPHNPIQDKFKIINN